MSLAIPRRADAAPSASHDDSFLERLGKLVPAEVLSLLLAATTLLPVDAWSGWSVVIVGAGLVLVLVALYWDAAQAAVRPSVTQHAVRALVYLAWACAISAPFAAWCEIDGRWAVAPALLLPIVGERLIAGGVQ